MIILYVVLAALLPGVVFVYWRFSRMFPSGDNFVKELQQKQINLRTHHIPFRDSSIFAVDAGYYLGTKVLFIHGSPGTWSGWKGLLADEGLLEEYHLIALDRPGYNKTTLPAQTELQTQAEVAITVLDQFAQPEDKVILVGHSYGGGVVEQLLTTHSNRFKSAVFAAPTLSPEFQKPKWYNYVGRLLVTQLILPAPFKSSNIEMFGLYPSLINIERSSRNMSSSIIFIHGEKDSLVPVETVDYFREKAPQNVEYWVEGNLNHLIPWKRPDLIVKAINKLAQ